jgi:integrase
VLAEAPKVELPKVDCEDESGGRPVTLEEFERRLEKTPSVVGEHAAPSWQHLLWGLWHSGLRIGEAITLSWDDPQQISVDFGGRRPLFRFPAKRNKRRKTIVARMTPDCAEFLAETLDEDREGFVFDVSVRHRDSASHVIAKIGKAAGVVVKLDGEDPPMKYASAHDLRRSFGSRWAKRVMPAVLKELMRHKSIQTTMTYYATQNAESVADDLWRQHEPDGQHFRQP